jgi:hypothetical protein
VDDYLTPTLISFSSPIPESVERLLAVLSLHDSMVVVYDEYVTLAVIVGQRIPKPGMTGAAHATVYFALNYDRSSVGSGITTLRASDCDYDLDNLLDGIESLTNRSPVELTIAVGDGQSHLSGCSDDVSRNIVGSSCDIVIPIAPGVDVEVPELLRKYRIVRSVEEHDGPTLTCSPEVEAWCGTCVGECLPTAIDVDINSSISVGSTTRDAVSRFCTKFDWSRHDVILL